MGVFVHPQGICESEHVGDGTRVWAFAHVLPEARIGADCNICDHVFIENDVVIGDRVTIKCGVQVWDGVELADDVFVGPNATFTNDPFPRSRRWPTKFPRTRVGPGASLGGNCVLLPGVQVGRNAMIGAGAVVTRDVPANAVVVGNPARIVGYTDAAGSVRAAAPDKAKEATASPLARMVDLKVATDLRGTLAAAEFATDLPFVPQRVFSVFGVPSADVRGEHAHRACEQVLVALRGSVRCIVDDGSERVEVLLDGPGRGLHMPAMTWGTQYGYSSDAVLLVLASLPYDSDDYIREYEEFLELARAGQGTPTEG